MSKRFTEETLLIEDFVFPNKGIGYFNGKPIKVKNAMIGQSVHVRIYKKRRGYEGRVLKIKKYSDMEIKPKCEDFLVCGGCTFQNIPYYKELEIKKNMVTKILIEANIDIVPEMIEAPKKEMYRNKMEFSFGDVEKGGKMALGMRKIDSFYEVVTSKNCNIIDADFKNVLLETLNFFSESEDTFYHKAKHEGALRHLIIRKGEFTKEIFINLVTTENIKSDITKWKDKILSLELKNIISGIAHTVNNSVSDAVICDKFNLLYGRDHFYEKLLGLNFKISPFSFFQTNSSGAEVLYSSVKEFVGESKNKIIFDLYCGTGTIAQILSKNAKKIIGIELVDEAVVKARENAELNGIDNCEFISGDVLTQVDLINEKPDVIVIDPPRDGIHKKSLEKIIEFDAEKIVYVSCKPTSLARDLQVFLESGYRIEKIRCHDMFPRTYHVETVCLMSRSKC